MKTQFVLSVSQSVVQFVVKQTRAHADQVKVLILASTALTLSSCEVSGTWSAHVPDETVSCEVPYADVMKIVYQSPYVPRFLTVSLNNDEFVFDECAPDSAQDSQGLFSVVRGSGTRVVIGLPAGSSLRDSYFPPYEGSVPIRSDISIRIMGRSSCAASPYTILPSTPLAVGWTPSTTDTGICAADGWAGTAVIQ